MDLIERYLAAVRRNLPQTKAEDIIAELRDEICSRQEAREEALGRGLSKDEAGALLKEFGHPLMVASRYRSHQYLIGPETFPFYLSVMRIVLMTVVAVIVAVSAGRALFGPGEPFGTLLQSMAGIWPAILSTAAIVTLIFAVLERTGFPADHLRIWTPDQLPTLADRQPGPWESAFEVALNLAFLLWWAGVVHFPDYSINPEFRMAPAPVFAELYWPILVLVSVRLVHNLIQWLRPRWRLVRGVLSAATALGGLALLALIYRAGRWAVVIPLHMNVAEAAKLQDSLNLGLKIAIVVSAVAWTFQCLTELWRIGRGRRRG